jgi:hypothetical protein
MAPPEGDRLRLPLATRTKRSDRQAAVLTSERIGKPSLKRYLAALTPYLAWCEELRADPSEAADFDELLSRYIQILYDNKCSLGEALTLRSSVVFFDPGLKGLLPLADRALEGWRRLEPAESWPPATYGLAFGAACELWLCGDVAHATAILLAFECYLRNDEVCKMSVRDVALPGDARVGRASTFAAVAIQFAKTGRRQWVTVRDPLVLSLLQGFAEGAQPSDKLLPGVSPDSFRQAFRRGLDLLGFPNAPYVVHSLRHGGATHDYTVGGLSLESVLERGRWRSTATARRYLQSARVLLLDVCIPTTVVTKIDTYLVDKNQIFSQ